MSENTNAAGVQKTFQDKEGKAITPNSFIKDENGNVYSVNRHYQAIPAMGEEAPAVELSSLLENSAVTVMSAKEVLECGPKVLKRRGRGRQPKPETPLVKDLEHNANNLQPAPLELVLAAIPSDALANELRRRGYTLCAVKPALINL